MFRTRRLCLAISAVVLTGPALAFPPTAAGTTAASDRARPSPEPSTVILDWEKLAMATVYPTKTIPGGVPLLGFTSVAMHDAVTRSSMTATSSETAAAARAAHDVLLHFFPGSASALDAQLATSLASVADPDERARGEQLGVAAAAEMLASRVGDGWEDPSIHYTKAPGVGVWQPIPPATDMLVPWLGSLDMMVLRHRVRVSGPDALTSRQYARDFNEVKRLGGTDASGTERTPTQTDTALFFNSNSATMVGDALVRHLASGAEDLTLADTALLFARMHAAMTDSVIQTWRLKREVGFWRPVQAVPGADLDHNRRTQPQAGWEPLLATPPYSEYVSGHASLTGPAVEVIRQTLGGRTPLELISVNSPTSRTYPSLGRLEHAAFMARIWGGLHFRDAMEDGYRIGHVTAHRVMRAMH